MRQTLGWTDRSREDGPFDVEAHRERNQWQFRRRRNRRDDWEIFAPSSSDWHALLDLVTRKYQRRRCAWRDVEQVQQFLEKSQH